MQTQHGLWLYLIILSRTRIRVNLRSIVAWISGNSLLEIATIFEVWPVWLNDWVFICKLSVCGFESRCWHTWAGHNDHISDICKKAGRKISALTRVTPYMGIAMKRILANAFFTSQFSYCPLVWMCRSRTNNNKINRLRERCLRIVYHD